MPGKDKLLIKTVDSQADLDRSLDVIRASFKTVADEFELNEENCPAHTAFLTMARLLDMKRRGLTLFGLFKDEVQLGFIAVEKGEGGMFWIEKLAVLPGERHHSCGKRLVSHAIDYIAANNGNRVRLGMIDEHKVLKDWYKHLGFKDAGAQKFPQLPFTVCFMEKDLSSGRD